MAKRIIQMYDKYQSTTKVYPKVIKDCLQEDVTSYIEGQVKANPTLAGTEGSLEGLQVGSTKYKVNQPINVVANPTLAGTEAELTGLQVGDTKYKAGGGKTLYSHDLCIWWSVSNSNYGKCYVKIINDDSTQFTPASLALWLYDKGYRFLESLPNEKRGLLATGYYYDSGYRNILALASIPDYDEQHQYIAYYYYDTSTNKDARGSLPLNSGGMTYLHITDIVNAI